MPHSMLILGMAVLSVASGRCARGAVRGWLGETVQQGEGEDWPLAVHPSLE
jgi:hypothetical protein